MASSIPGAAAELACIVIHAVDTAISGNDVATYDRAIARLTAPGGWRPGARGRAAVAAGGYPSRRVRLGGHHAGGRPGCLGDRVAVVEPRVSRRQVRGGDQARQKRLRRSVVDQRLGPKITMKAASTTMVRC